MPLPEPSIGWTQTYINLSSAYQELCEKYDELDIKHANLIKTLEKILNIVSGPCFGAGQSLTLNEIEKIAKKALNK